MSLLFFLFIWLGAHWRCCWMKKISLWKVEKCFFSSVHFIYGIYWSLVSWFFFNCLKYSCQHQYSHSTAPFFCTFFLLRGIQYLFKDCTRNLFLKEIIKNQSNCVLACILNFSNCISGFFLIFKRKKEREFQNFVYV